MSKLSAEEIAQHAYKAGFRGDALTTAVAVAMAESGGNTKAHNATPPDNSYGLWQVNMLGGLGPARRKEYGIDSNSELFDADENAKAAYKISGHGKSFGPWSTYTNGAYKKHLTEARKAAKEVAENHGKSTAKKPAHHEKHPGKKGGFKADPAQFRTYASQADDVAAQLKEIGAKTVQKVTGIAKDSFGAVGKETGFADALGDFSRSLEKQVSTTAGNARTLSEQTRKAASQYKDHDDAALQTLSSADISGVLG
ncbi:transglycosylase SLT domain-containing protein [Amycolatopsis acidicola]|uniref:Transglycosylase SLT domain-containing protein n=1 Tax=Amycolatopsis acidicola TaxID=2596893 RepID=A0A5N0UHT7_9PSEU|nr:type VII secretion target [Amycolatopsis acidicola]KAA9148161.1 transglycosylase SLT domain-containing protein [Amycolatopsis acidicola]